MKWCCLIVLKIINIGHIFHLRGTLNFYLKYWYFAPFNHLLKTLVLFSSANNFVLLRIKVITVIKFTYIKPVPLLNLGPIDEYSLWLLIFINCDEIVIASGVSHKITSGSGRFRMSHWYLTRHDYCY